MKPHNKRKPSKVTFKSHRKHKLSLKDREKKSALGVYPPRWEEEPFK